MNLGSSKVLSMSLVNSLKFFYSVIDDLDHALNTSPNGG
jgi:hypothetical protein